MLHLFVHQYLFLKCITEFLHWNYHWVFLWFCRLYSDGLELGSDLWLPAVVLWNSASHVSTMLRSNLDLSDILSDIRPWYSTHPPSFGEVFSRRHRRALEKQGQKKQTKHSKQQDNTSMTVTVLVPGIRLFNFGNYCFNSSINFCD